MTEFQPTFPIHAAFFYPWFPQAWTQQGIYPYTNYHPTLGFYSSTDNATIDQQLRLAATAHLDAFISSWWGQGSPTDSAFQYIIDYSTRSGSPDPNLRWAIYYEPEGQGDPIVSQIVSDLNYLKSTVFGKPGYLKVNGKPVVFVYADPSDGSAMASRWAQAKAQFGTNVYVVLKVYPGYRTEPNQPDSWHQYGPAVAIDEQLPYSVSVSPGFWKVGETPRLARDVSVFDTNVQKMVSSGAAWQLITTWNEWGEGTAVEPAAEFSNQYITSLCSNLPGTAPCPRPSATSTPRIVSSTTATPIRTPTPIPATATPTRTASPTNTATAAPTETQTPTAGVPNFSHIYVLVMENREYSSIVGNASAPYINSLIQQYGLATNYNAVVHPSEPNYIALWSGSPQGVTDDGVHNLSGTNLVDQLETHGKTWRVYAQNVPLNCYTGSSASGGEDGTGTYVRKHEPAISFTDVQSNPNRCANITDFTHFDPAAADFELIIPNLCNDMHDCSTAVGDSFLRGFVPRILNSAAWQQGGVLFLVWDEGSTNVGGGGHIAALVISNQLRSSGFTSSVLHDHYSLLRTIENAWGLGCLNNSCSANDLREFFK